MFSQRKFLFPLPAYQNHMVALFAFSHVISGAFSYRQAYVFAQPQRIGNIYVYMCAHTPIHFSWLFKVFISVYYIHILISAQHQMFLVLIFNLIITL